MINCSYYSFLIQFILTLAHDGSGKGAALVAAVAERMMDKRANIIMSNNMNNNIEETTPSTGLKKAESDVEMSSYRNAVGS